MVHIFRNFYVDKLSFWVGILVGGLAFFLLSRLLPLMGNILSQWFKPLQSQLQLRRGTTEYHYRNDLLKQAQRQHLAHQLFPLDDLIVPPKLLVSPPVYEPGVWSVSEDITYSTIPFLIDCPELASAYNSPAFTLADALKGGANLVIVGQPGAGKTVTLADFASRVARKEIPVSNFHDHLLLFLHVTDLCPFEKSTKQLFQIIIDVVTQNASRQIQKQLPKMIEFKLRQGKVLLLLDGLDELPEKHFDQAVNIISTLRTEHPNIQMIVTASTEYTGQLNRLGFIPIPLASWSKAEKYKLIDKWEKAWVNALRESNQTFDIDTALINSWFILDQLDETPFELTLKLWAAYAGDVLGAASGSEIFAHLQRSTKKEKRLVQSMGQLALQMVTTETPWLTQKDVEHWAHDWDHNIQPVTNLQEIEADNQEDFILQTRVTKTFQDMIDANIARPLSDNHIILYHPLFTSYLAANAINTLTKTINIFGLPEWEVPTCWATRSQTFKYLTYHPQIDAIIDHYTQLDGEFTYFNLLKIGRWIKNVPSDSQWYAKIMRKLAGIMQKDEFSLNLRVRVLLAMIATQDPGINTFIKGMLASDKASFRQLAALGCGLLQDESAFDGLNKLLTDPVPDVHRAACLALVNIGSRSAIDAVAYLLLNGNEHQRQAAAEAIANHPIESVAILQEGSEMDDLRIRRATVYGLKRIAKTWAIEILHKLSIEDDEWIVKDAAMHAIESLEQEDARSILPLKAASDIPWLLAFAGERGMGISPGSNAHDIILLALNEGNEEQKLAALSFLKAQGEPVGLDQILHILKTDQGVLKESAFNTLWYLAMTGVVIPDNTRVS